MAMEIYKLIWSCLLRPIKPVMVYLLSNSVLPVVFRTVIAVVTVFISVWLKTNDSASLYIKMFAYVIVFAAVAAMLTPSIREFYAQSDYVGYWVYGNTPDEDSESDFKQFTDTLRIVEIKHGKQNLKIKGNLTNVPERHFVSYDVTPTGFGDTEGRLYYRYKAPDNVAYNKRYSGLVVLDWEKESLSSSIDKMVGRFYSDKGQYMGTVDWNRVDKKKFDELRKIGELS
ncbi:hypothetical protein Q2Y22_001283 [Vibrio vulnificus]|nr:hypothetical protein [Vibrio vulnificus]